MARRHRVGERPVRLPVVLTGQEVESNDAAAAEPREDHLVRVKKLHEADLEAGYGEVYVPDTLSRKYPGAPRQWAWQYVFLSRTRSVDLCSEVVRRHHADEKALQRAMQEVVRRAAGVSAVHTHPKGTDGVDRTASATGSC